MESKKVLTLAEAAVHDKKHKHISRKRLKNLFLVSLDKINL